MAPGSGRRPGARRSHGRARWHRLVAGTAVLALAATTAACGARWDDDQRAEVEGRALGAVAGTADDPATAPGTATGAAASATTTPGGGTAGATTGAAATGTSTGSAGPAAPGSPSAAGPRPCAAASDAPGVTDRTLTLGTLSSLSGPVPGLGASALAAARAYVAYRNATGGVCGRQVVLKDADDGMDNARNRALARELAPQILAVAGGLAGGDPGGAPVLAEAGIPAVVTAVSDQMQDSPTTFDINPPFADVRAPVAKFRFLVEQGVRTAAIVYLGADQTRSEVVGKQRPQMEAAGIKVVNFQELPLSTLSFDSAARGVANSKADYLLFVSDATQSASMARSMRDTGYSPKFSDYLVAYGTTFPELAGAAAEGAMSWIRTVPNEDARSNAEATRFLEWMDRTAPGVVADTFAADSWVAAKAVLDAVEALPGPITRAGLLAQLKATDEYDAGGMLGPIRLGPKQNKGCVVGMIYRGGAWQRLTPASGFLC